MNSSCVTEKFCRSNKLLRGILNRRESSPVEVFRRSFLKRVDNGSYDLFCSKGFLDEFYQDPEETTFYDDEGNAYWVRKEKGGYWAYPKSADSLCKIRLSDDDLQLVRFENNNFAKLLKSRNDLTGSCSELTKCLFCVGNHKVLKTNIWVALAFIGSDKTAEKEFLSLPSRIPEAKMILVICPTYYPESAELAKRLEDKKIICRKFDDILDDDFHIKFDTVVKEDHEEGFQVPPIRQKEKAGYNTHHYKCLDVFKFIDEDVGYRQISIKINGKSPLSIKYSEAALFMLLAIKLKENTGGFVSLQDMTDEGIVPKDNQTKTNNFTRMHRLVSDLRKTLKKHASDDILEGVKGEGRYRLSTHPNRITEPSSNWLKKTYKHVVLPAVKAEREKRLKTEA